MHPTTKIVEKGQPLFFKEHQERLYKSLEDKHTTIEVNDDDPLNTRMILNMGPQHPATHGVLRVLLELDGEVIMKNRLDVGYLHRGVEKIPRIKRIRNSCLIQIAWIISLLMQVMLPFV